MPKKIGLLTSGGDCAGLNSFIRSVYLAAKRNNWSVIGIEDGIPGLMTHPVKTVNIGEIFESKNGYALLRIGGTCLGTKNKLEGSMAGDDYLDHADLFVEGYRSLGLDALIASGGDGSLTVLRKLCKRGNIPFVGVPKTIDNDICYTESIGFATSVEVATEALDRLQPTAASHSRVMILEVMGRDAGNIALYAGVSGDADIILIPEVPFNIQAVVDHISKIRKGGRNFAIIVAAESAHPIGEEPKMIHHKNGSKHYGGMGAYLCELLDGKVDGEVRATTLGHVQRGGRPIFRDRLLAAAFGAKAIECVEKEEFDCMVAWHNSTVGTLPLERIMDGYSGVDLQGEIAQTALRLGISFGVDESVLQQEKINK